MGQHPDDEQNDQPSLDLPSLSLPGFRRKKVSKEEHEEKATPSTAPQPTSEQPASEEPASERGLDEPTADPYHHATTGPAASNGDATRILQHEPSAPARRRARRKLQNQEEHGPGARSTPRLPALPGRVAAAVTGLVVGVAGGAATYGALAGCEAVRGVSTCGGAPGFFILVAILALMVLLGGAVLKALGVGAPGSTSFLAVGMVAVVSMLVLLEVIMSPFMFVVIPVLSALSFVSAHWVTTQFDEEPTDLRR